MMTKTRGGRTVLKGEIIFSFVLLAGVLVFLIESLSFPARPRILPLGILVVLALLICLDTCLKIRKALAGSGVLPAGEEGQEGVNTKLVRVSFAVLVGGVFLTYLTGLAVSVAAMAFTLTWLYTGKKLAQSLFNGVLGGVIIYFLFFKLLNIPIPRGFLFS